MTPTQRFNAKVQKQASGCWLWTGACNGDGLPEFIIEGRRLKVRRWAWRKGPKPKRIGTSCNERLCVRPAHLIPVRSGPKPSPGITADPIVQFMLDNPRSHLECTRLFQLTELELLDILDVYYESQPRTDIPTETAPLHTPRISKREFPILTQLFETTEELW